MVVWKHRESWQKKKREIPKLRSTVMEMKKSLVRLGSSRKMAKEKINELENKPIIIIQ